jgi:hypothetical protein
VVGREISSEASSILPIYLVCVSQANIETRNIGETTLCMCVCECIKLHILAAF